MISHEAMEPATEPATQGRDAVAGSVAFGGLYAGIAGLGVAALAEKHEIPTIFTIGHSSMPFVTL